MNKTTIFLLTLALLTGCANNKEAALALYGGGEVFSNMAAADMVMAEAASDSDIAYNQPLAAADIQIERKIIRRGDISFETESAERTRKVIIDKANALNGYISDESENSYGGRVTHRVTVKVPADNFYPFLEAVAGSASKIIYKNITARDVTEEYIDIEARLNTKKEIEKRYIALLRRAYSVEDILAIEREVGNLRSEIESVEGRLRYLQNSVAYSILSIEYYQIGESARDRFSSRAGEGVGEGWQSLQSFAVMLISMWPFILIGIAVIWLIIIWKKRRRRNRY